MKAIVHEKYGLPGGLLFKDVPRPTPAKGEVLVQVVAASLNYGDVALAKGEPFLVRLMGHGLFKPKNPIPGGDIAGQVVAVGQEVNQLIVGDPVLGDIGGCGFGAYAEYAAAPANMLVKKPPDITFEQAAAVPQAALVALQGLRDNGRIQSGHKVLVNGASGGVGTFAVQIAKALGAEVTAVCSTRNLDLVRSIGADQVIDYTVEDFTRKGERYDLVFDIVANRKISQYMQVLNPRGSYVACAFNPSALFFGGVISKQAGKKASALVHKPDQEDLAFMNTLLEAGKVKPVIDRCYPLQQVPEAMRYLQGGNHRGKVVIQVV